ncbi:MAG: ArnT family glycosyltransferase [Candidatus Dormibacteraceae bacterium]
MITRLRSTAIAPFSLAALVYTLFRLPSFFEPHWYTDEAGYATTAREMLRGKLLYAGIWNNKPPLHLWTTAASLRLFGPSEVGFHLVTYLFGLAALGGAAYAAFRLLSRPRAFAAVFAVAIILGTPVLDAQLLIPESLLIAPSTWAGALLLVRLRPSQPAPGWRWPALVGLLAAVATAYQQTSLAESAAFLLILLLSPGVTRRQTAAFVAAFTATTAAWLVPAVILAGWSNVSYALAGFYVSYTTTVLPHDLGGLLVLAGSMLLATVLAVAGAILGRHRRMPWAGGLWAAATLLAAAAPQHAYPHLMLPAIVPTVLLVANVPWPSRRLLPAGQRLRLGTVATASAVLIAAGLARITGLDWMSPLYSDSNSLAGYYGGLALVAAQQDSISDWRESFDARVGPDAEVALWLRMNGLSGYRAVVWSSDCWLYLLADMDEVMPTPPIYNNFALLGQNGQVSAFVRSQLPDVIITADPDTTSFPEISELLDEDYTQAFTSGLDHVWILNSSPAAETAEAMH